MTFAICDDALSPGEQALYLLFNEGYHGSDADSPLHPAKLARYSSYWAARADIERRGENTSLAIPLYVMRARSRARSAIACAKRGAGRGSYERRLRQLEN